MCNTFQTNNVWSENPLFPLSPGSSTTPGDKRITDTVDSYSIWRIIPGYKRESSGKVKRKMESQATCEELAVPDGHIVTSVLLPSRPPAWEGRVACAWRWVNHFPQNQCFNILLGTHVKLDWRRMRFGKRLRCNKWDSLWEVSVVPNTKHCLQ